MLIENEIERDLMTDGYDRPDGHKIASVGLFLSFSIENEMQEEGSDCSQERRKRKKMSRENQKL